MDTIRTNDVQLTREQIQRILHPREFSRLLLATSASIVLVVFVLVVFILVILSHEIFHLGYIFIGLLVLTLPPLVSASWFSSQIRKARLIGHAVRVSPSNYPEIEDILQWVCWKLDCNTKIHVYIVNETGLNARLVKFFGNRYILLTSSLVAGMPPKECRNELAWVIARFVGALQARHLRFHSLLSNLSVVINSRILNSFIWPFISPYERSTELSGDQIGMAVVGSVRSSMTALAKLITGHEIVHDLRLRGMLEQGRETHVSLFGTLSILLSSHPHMTERFLNLLAFARFSDVNGYVDYIRDFDQITIDEVDRFLPDYYVKDPLPSHIVRNGDPEDQAESEPRTS